MNVDTREMEAFGDRLRGLRKEIPKIMEQLIVGEGVFAVKQAQSICTEDKVVNNGTYRMNFHTGNKSLTDPGNVLFDGSKVRRSGNSYRIDVYNNLDYAKHLEWGFRSHFVPGYWEGHTFKYQPGFPGGMFVGPGKDRWVNGHFTLHRALRRTKQTQDARLMRKFDKIVGAWLDNKGATNDTN